jgi:hypothetical protein
MGRYFKKYWKKTQKREYASEINFIIFYAKNVYLNIFQKLKII